MNNIRVIYLGQTLKYVLLYTNKTRTEQNKCKCNEKLNKLHNICCILDPDNSRFHLPGMSGFWAQIGSVRSGIWCKPLCRQREDIGCMLQLYQFCQKGHRILQKIITSHRNVLLFSFLHNKQFQQHAC